MTLTDVRSSLAALLIGATLAAPCYAERSGPPAATLAERLKALYPATRFGAINATPWAGVFEVTLGNQLAYVDASGQFFLFGHLYDMTAQRDLTAERKDLLTRIEFAALPLADALMDRRGNGSRTLAVFSDPDCPYCRKLEAELKGLTDVTIYTFLYPLASLHPEARSKAIALWCAPRPLEAWQALMTRNVLPAPADCAHPVDRNVALGERLGISGTPTLIAQDGRVLAGAAGLAQIEAWLGADRRDLAR
jgi:thiol:disulfide interchange protein DsbC